MPHDKPVDDFPLPVPEVSPNSSLETAVFGREQSQNCGYTDNSLEIKTSGVFNSGCWNRSSQEYLGTFDWGLGYDGMLGGFQSLGLEDLNPVWGHIEYPTNGWGMSQS